MSESDIEDSGQIAALGRPVIALLAVGVALLLLALYVAISTFQAVDDNTAAVEHTLEVENAIYSITAHNERIETARRGYIIQPQGRFRSVIIQTQRAFDRDAKRVRRLTSDNSRQRMAIDQVIALDRERDGEIARLLNDPNVRLAQLQSAAFDNERGVALTRELRTVLNAMVAEEGRLLALRNQQQLASVLRLYWVGGAAVVLLLVILASVIVLMMGYNRELNRTQAMLATVNQGLERSVAERTAELTRANQEIQRFAYIVSHDLRSPLVNVLGFTAELDEARKVLQAYLERVFAEQPDLRDENVRLAVEEDLPEALGFIRTSTEKMDRLINSILELSRQGRRQLRPEELDMNGLVGGVVATLHQRAEDAGATITVGALPTIESDRLAIEQILSNLIENALKYLSPKRAGEIIVSGRRAGKLVQIDVKDNGRGIDPFDHQRIFELFRRSGTQDQPGEGIGLANVRALAFRLGGTIEVESELDQGASFRLSLPAKFVATEPLE